MRLPIAVLACLVLLASAARAQDAFDPGWCRGGMFGSDAAALDRLSLGRVGGAPVRLQRDFDRCPGEVARCATGRALPPGAPLALLQRDLPDFRCAASVGAPGPAAGWLPAAAVLPARRAPPLRREDWLGTWRMGDARIRLRPGAGAALRADGQAFWPGRNTPPANAGGFDAEATPAVDRLVLRETGTAGCVVTLRLLADGAGRRALAVSDNGGCGGANVRFNGIYRRAG
jgi:hypothetical protein